MTARELLRTVRRWGYTWPGGEVTDAHVSELTQFLQTIGLMDPRGEAYQERDGKFEQAVAFCLQLAGALRKLSTKRELLLLDAGCGRSYLSFVANHYLAQFLGRSIRFVGVDANERVVARCREAQAALGWDNMEFHTAPIAGFRLPRRPDIVMSLHACDTATDGALALGLRTRARFLFSAACCQRTARAHLRGRELGQVVRHSPFRERVADMLADSLRALLLESAGYRVDLVEFVPSSATLKNVLLRAECIDRPRPEARARADELSRHFGLRPALPASRAGPDACVEGRWDPRD
jgi:SAM-dependent methyltransferase